MSEKTPASQMIRVPTALVTAVKELSTLHRQGHTKAILQVLQELIASLGSSAAISESGSDRGISIIGTEKSPQVRSLASYKVRCPTPDAHDRHCFKKYPNMLIAIGEVSHVAIWRESKQLVNVLL